ncbi:hypothetical protein R2Q26_01690 [Nitrosomonas sp. Is37]|nr:hypothetical protein [Nitrosomonas sp. Is37]MDV6343277.1 hypothetical protein [Nitrosomonas sp. Is37]
MFRPDIWVKRVEIAIEYGSKSCRECVLSDVRFDNEAEMIKRNDGVIWHIERKNNPFAINTEYESEHGIDGEYIDWIIHNDGDIDQLQTEIACALDGMTGIMRRRFV